MGLELLDPSLYQSNGYPHATWTRLRAESPIERFEIPGYHPFWAITKHAHVREVSTRPQVFQSADSHVQIGAEDRRPLAEIRRVLKRALPAPAHQFVRSLLSVGQGRSETSGQGCPPRFLIEMDPPKHRAHCRIGNDRFAPRAIRDIRLEIEKGARELVDGLARDPEGECDFVDRVAAYHPARVITRILGLPEADVPFVVRISNEWFGQDDPEYVRDEGELKRLDAVTREFVDYIDRVIEDRRRTPRDDLASEIANAVIDGEPMGRAETLGYYLILFTAGHETTRNTIAGGLLALLEHPDQLQRLRADPGLIPTAVEEMVRWSSPVNYMTRRAVEDYSLGGTEIRAGDRLVLFYASANRDEDVFSDPFEFRIDRAPNPHLGFGIGEHYCMGAKLAIATSSALFSELIPRLEHIELAGQPERLASSFVAGYKHLPIRYRMRTKRSALT